MRKYTLKPAALGVIVAALFILCGVGTLLCWIYLSSMEIIMYIGFGIFAAAAVIFGIFLLPLYFHRTVIYLSAVQITMHTGVLFLRREHMKLDAVQYVTKITMPLSRFTGFNFIILHGLGGTLLLPFLSAADCDEIERQIVREGASG